MYLFFAIAQNRTFYTAPTGKGAIAPLLTPTQNQVMLNKKSKMQPDNLINYFLKETKLVK
ncbi:hypothetical protein C7B62_04970 [Pleurocapsa sp. CCALA 161]|nr:hypothetical protein C7B62_04970 [Pleurocapsa sp. CCALA 161]